MAYRPPVVTPQMEQRAARAAGVDPRLLAALVNQESGGRTDARSPAGALGPTQLMPGTARGLGVNPSDPNQNLLGGARYLRQQLDRFHGSIPLALSAYNSGPGGSEASGRVEGIPETQNYVRSIMAKLGGGAPSRPLPYNGQPLQDTAGAAPDPRRQFATALLGAIQGGQLNTAGLIGALQQRQSSSLPPEAPPGPTLPTSAPAPAPTGGSLAELLHEGVGGPTHSTGEHVHAASTNPQVMLALIAEAERRGLAVRENPYTDPVDPVHAKNSFHNRTFPGRYNGRSLGEAVDVSGPGMSAYEQWVRKTYGGGR